MDPFSISVACVGLLSGITTISSKLTEFGSHAINAEYEIAALQRELIAFRRSLSHFDFDDLAAHCPAILKSDLLKIITDCNQVLEKLSSLITRINPDRISGRFQWSLSIHDEVKGLRQNLETYKSAINITLMVTSLSLGCSIKNDTSIIKDQVLRLSKIEQPVFEILSSIQALTQNSASRLKLSYAAQQFLEETESHGGSIIGTPEVQLNDRKILADGGLEKQPNDNTRKRQCLKAEKPTSKASRKHTFSMNEVPRTVQNPGFVDVENQTRRGELREHALGSKIVKKEAKKNAATDDWPETETPSQNGPGSLRKRAKRSNLRETTVDQRHNAASAVRVEHAGVRKSKSSIMISNWNLGYTLPEQIRPNMPSEMVSGDVRSTQKDYRTTSENPRISANSKAPRKSKSSNWAIDNHASHTLPGQVSRKEIGMRETVSSRQSLRHNDTQKAIPPMSNCGIAATMRSLRPSGWSFPREVTDDDFKLMAGLGTPSVSTPNLRFWDFADFSGHELYFEHDDNQDANSCEEDLALKSFFNRGWTEEHLRNTAERLCEVTLQHLKVLKPKATDVAKEHWIRLEIQLSRLSEGRFSLPKYRPAKSCMSIGIGQFLVFENLGDCEYAYSQMVPYSRTFRTASATMLNSFRDVRSADEKLIALLTIAATLSSMFSFELDLLKRLEGDAFGDCLGMALYKAAGMKDHFSAHYCEPEVLSRLLYKMSASFGYIPALIELAQCYLLGTGGPKDYDAFQNCRGVWNRQMYLNGFTVWNDSGCNLGAWHWKDTICDKRMWDYLSKRTEAEVREKRLKESKSRLSLQKMARSWWYGY